MRVQSGIYGGGELHASAGEGQNITTHADVTGGDSGASSSLELPLWHRSDVAMQQPQVQSFHNTACGAGASSAEGAEGQMRSRPNTWNRRLRSSSGSHALVLDQPQATDVSGVSPGLAATPQAQGPGESLVEQGGSAAAAAHTGMAAAEEQAQGANPVEFIIVSDESDSERTRTGKRRWRRRNGS